MQRHTSNSASYSESKHASKHLCHITKSNRRPPRRGAAIPKGAKRKVKTIRAMSNIHGACARRQSCTLARPTANTFDQHVDTSAREVKAPLLAGNMYVSEGPAINAGLGAHSTLRIRKRICAGMTQSMPPALLAGNTQVSIRSCYTCRPWCSQHLAHLKANMRRHDSKHAASIAGWKHVGFHKVLLYMQAVVLAAPCAFENEYAQA